MLRVPSVNPDRDRRIAALEAKLAKVRGVPVHRRSAQFIPEKTETAIEVLAHLRQRTPTDCAAPLMLPTRFHGLISALQDNGFPNEAETDNQISDADRCDEG